VNDTNIIRDRAVTQQRKHNMIASILITTAFATISLIAFGAPLLPAIAVATVASCAVGVIAALMEACF
jgi:hypothetical protein